MSTFEIVQIVIDVLLFLAIVGSLWYCVPKLKNYRRMVQIMSAKSKAVPTDPELIQEWKQKREALPNGSPKWEAYTRALKAEGHEV